MKDVFYISAWSKDDPAGGIYTYKLSEKGVEQVGGAPLFMAGYL